MTDKTIDQLDANTGLVRGDKLEVWDTSGSASVKALLSDILPLILAADISDSSAASRAIITAASNAAIKALLDLEIGVDLQAYGLDLTAIEALTGTGFPARTSDNTWAARSLAGDTGVTITNPSGVAGNPTVALSTILVALNNLATNGLIARTASGTLAARTLQADGTALTWTNGDGVSGNPAPALHAAIKALAQTAAADKLPYYTSSSAASLADFPTVARTLLAQTTAAAQRSTLSVDKFCVAAFIESPTAKTYTLLRRPGFAFTVNSMTHKTVSGTVTIAARIGGSVITGLSAVGATSTQTVTSASGANSVSTTDRLEVQLTSLSSPTDLSVTFDCTRG